MLFGRSAQMGEIVFWLYFFSLPRFLFEIERLLAFPKRTSASLYIPKIRDQNFVENG